MDFFLPKNPNYVSGSLTKSPGTSDSKIEVEAHSIQFLMEKFGHTEIDVLKMDIEGAEYDVLESLIDSGTINNIGQICVEFHFRFGCGLVKRTEEIFKSLKNKGFKLVYAAANQEEFTFARINSDNFNLKKTVFYSRSNSHSYWLYFLTQRLLFLYLKNLRPDDKNWNITFSKISDQKCAIYPNKI